MYPPRNCALHEARGDAWCGEASALSKSNLPVAAITCSFSAATCDIVQVQRSDRGGSFRSPSVGEQVYPASQKGRGYAQRIHAEAHLRYHATRSRRPQDSGQFTHNCWRAWRTPGGHLATRSICLRKRALEKADASPV